MNDSFFLRAEYSAAAIISLINRTESTIDGGWLTVQEEYTSANRADG